MNNLAKNIFVFGSLNMDLVIGAPYMPQSGETLIGGDFMTNSGGKGANQATACAKLGGNVFMGGCVGTDSFGEQMLLELNKVSVDTKAVRKCEGESGIAVIIVENGNNRIILNSGANGKANNDDVDRLLENAKENDILLLQLENNIDVVGYAIKAGRKKNMYVILNPAPMNENIKRYLKDIDLIIPNETEFLMLTQSEDIEKGRIELEKVGVKNIVVTLGNKGYCYSSMNQIICEDCIKAPVVDTTAAGDTFCGALATRLALGESMADSLRFANKSASITITRKGASKSIPTLAEVVEKFKI